MSGTPDVSAGFEEALTAEGGGVANTALSPEFEPTRPTLRRRA